MRSTAPSHALKGLCVLLSTFVAVTLAALSPTSASAETAPSPVDTSVTLTSNASRVAYGSHPVLTMTVHRSTDGQAINGTVQLFHRASSTYAWAAGAAVATSGGVARFSYTATRGLYFKAIYKASAAYSSSTSPVRTITVNSALGPRAVTEASHHAGAPYQYGAAGPTRFDCSGFTRYVFARFGKSLPHNSSQQYGSVHHISKSSVRVGDLIFIYDGGGIHHVGIYAGNGYMWHAPHTGDHVRKGKIWTSAYYVGRVG